MTSTANMRTRISGEINRRPADVIGPNGLTVGGAINREINSAVRHYEGMRVWWTEVRNWYISSTVDGQRYYSLTSDFLKMDSLVIHYNSSKWPLRERTWDDIEDKDRSIDDIKGTPQSYVIYGNEIRLFPIPNGAYSLIGSYVKSTPRTSLTGSYTTTATSTASHNDRTGGWYEYGEEVIRERAKAAVMINYFRDTNARTESALLKQQGKEFLSMQEGDAYAALLDKSKDRLSTGRVRPYFI